MGGVLKQAKLARTAQTVGELFNIPAGAQNSNSVPWTANLGDAEAFSISAPAVLPETVQIQLDPGDGTFRTLVDSTNTPVTTPTAGNVQVFNGIATAAANIRLQATGVVAADRNFQVWKAFRA